MVIFHGNAGKKLRHHGKSKPHTNAILAITSTRIDKSLVRSHWYSGENKYQQNVGFKVD